MKKETVWPTFQLIHEETCLAVIGRRFYCNILDTHSILGLHIFQLLNIFYVFLCINILAYLHKEKIDMTNCVKQEICILFISHLFHCVSGVERHWSCLVGACRFGYWFAVCVARLCLNIIDTIPLLMIVSINGRFCIAAEFWSHYTITKYLKTMHPNLHKFYIHTPSSLNAI